MYSIRRWLYKPRKDDTSILAQFFYADEDLNNVATELDSFDGRKEPERCTHLVNQLRQCQDKVLNICNQIMDEVIPDQRANRDFRVKFPDDVLQENLAGQLWFGAECLAAGSSIMNREVESASMRPLAKAVTKTLDNVRNLLKEQCLRNPLLVTDKVREALRVFDRFFAEFELSYVSAMVPVKTMREYDTQQEVIVLFSETLHRALYVSLISQEMVDDYDPALMFTIPRLAIICGLLIYPDGPLNVNLDSDDMSEMFRPFRNLLRKIREVLWSLNKIELNMLEKALCNVEEPGKFQTSDDPMHPLPNVDDYVQKVCADYPSCKQFINDYYDFNLPHDPSDEAEEVEEHPPAWMQDCNTGEELLMFQESLSHTLTKVIERSGTRDSGMHSDTCSNASESSHNGQCIADLEEDKCVKQEEVPFKMECDHVSRLESSDRVMVHLVAEAVDGVVKERIESVENSDAATVSQLSSDVEDGHGAIPKRCSENECSQHTSATTGTSSPSRKVQQRRLFHKTFHSCPSSPYGHERNSSELRHVYSDNWVYSSSGSSCRSVSSSEWDSDCCSSETSSYNSECQDDEEIALAIQAAEIATRSGALGRFRSTDDLVHRLFVCIAGVADQLQTNHAGDLRNILKYVFQMNCSEPVIPPSPLEKRSQLITNMILEEEQDRNNPSEESLSVESAEEANENDCHPLVRNSDEPPRWIPDDVAPECMSCKATFNVVRRRHHCRNCGKVFCSKCSSNSVPLPHYGHSKPVRVCNNCFVFQVTPFLIEDEA